MFKNIVVTGKKQVGKSTLVNRYLDEIGASYVGFRTKCVELTSVGPIYAIEDIVTKEKQNISQSINDKIVGISKSFDTFGTDIILNALNSNCNVILLDEIGRFEKDSKNFLSAIDSAFDSDKTIIAVLKKENLPHLKKIRDRKDVLVIDLDDIPFDSALKIMLGESDI